MSRNRRLWLLALGPALLSACGALRPATVPMRSVVVHDGHSGRCMAVLLPGRFAAPESFIKGKFGEAVEARHLPIDLVAVDAHLGYYRTRTVLDRIREDVILPAKTKGYDEIWLVGTSLGGLGSLFYLRDHPEDISGVLVIAPFLGDERVIHEVEAAGSPLQWKPPAEIKENDVGRQLWSWLSTGRVADEKVPVSIGWGTNDPFERSNRLLASMLPQERTFPVEGKHDLETWNRVWIQFLDQGWLCRTKR